MSGKTRVMDILRGLDMVVMSRQEFEDMQGRLEQLAWQCS